MGDASILSEPGTIDRLVFLGASPNGPAEKLQAPSLVIMARDDANADGLRLPGIRAQYEKAPQPKELIILDGSAHAQFLFQTDQGEKVMREFFDSLPENSLRLQVQAGSELFLLLATRSLSDAHDSRESVVSCGASGGD